MIPLLAHESPQAVFAWRGGTAITARQFVADVQALAALLPAGSHALNVCTDRYRFVVGLAACMVAGKTSLLPPTQVPEVIRHLKNFAPDAFCLTDSKDCNIDLQKIQYPLEPALPAADYRVPEIAADRLVAHVFTSGSTGVPVPHPKIWSDLVTDVAVEAQRSGFNDGRHWGIVATVPPQHMYGFESSVLVAMRSCQALVAERPFYPADIAATLAALPCARALVSTPVHLRALLASGIAVPPVDLVVCATAPLEATLAAEVEARLGAPLLEIYGSTETGQIASRRPASGIEWTLWPGVTLSHRDGSAWAEGGHVRVPTPLGDVLEILSGGRFILQGRTQDLINIGGKRSSLAYLNHQLTSIPGVADCAFFMPEAPAGQSTTGTARLGALVVAPQLTTEAIIRALRARVDPVFLPRPLLRVECIPRNSTGKLPLAALRSLTAGKATACDAPVPP